MTLLSWSISSRNRFGRIASQSCRRVQCGHFLRWLVISRLTRENPGLRVAKLGIGGIRGDHTKCKSYFSRSSLAKALNFGMWARGTEKLLGRTEWRIPPPEESNATINGALNTSACIGLMRECAVCGLVW